MQFRVYWKLSYFLQRFSWVQLWMKFKWYWLDFQDRCVYYKNEYSMMQRMQNARGGWWPPLWLVTSIRVDHSSWRRHYYCFAYNITRYILFNHNYIALITKSIKSFISDEEKINIINYVFILKSSSYCIYNLISIALNYIVNKMLYLHKNSLFLSNLHIFHTMKFRFS